MFSKPSEEITKSKRNENKINLRKRKNPTQKKGIKIHNDKNMFDTFSERERKYLT